MSSYIPHQDKNNDNSLKHDHKQGANITVSAPGKIILHGEHSVVYGKLALAASLGLRTRLNLVETPASDPHEILIVFKDLNLTKSYNVSDLHSYLLDSPLPLIQECESVSWGTPENVHFEKLLKRVEEFVQENAIATNCELTHDEHLSLISMLYLFTIVFSIFKLRTLPLIITVKTDLTVSAGLGSSASYLVCVATALYQYTRIKSNSQNAHLEKEELDLISRWAFSAEKIIHGTPSGIDNTICTYGSMVGFRKGGIPNPIDHPKDMRVLLINTKIPKSTKALVAKVFKLKEIHGEIVDPIMNSIEAICNSAVMYLTQLRDIDCQENSSVQEDLLYAQLGEITDINQSLLKALGASHKSIDLICSIISEFNLHCKLTGAGGGGYCITIIPPRSSDEVLKEITEKLTSHGFDAVLTNLGGPGVTIH